MHLYCENQAIRSQASAVGQELPEQDKSTPVETW